MGWPEGWASPRSILCLQALNRKMSKKINSSEASAASNAAPGSPINKRVKDRGNDLAMAATPSDEVMNALFEQVAVRGANDI